jgi:hypothetical protein
MMKPIRNLRELEHEKMRLRLQRLELERSIRKEWDALKLTAAGALLLRQALERVERKESASPNWFSALLQWGTAAVSEKIGKLTAEKIETALNQALRFALKNRKKK